MHFTTIKAQVRGGIDYKKAFASLSVSQRATLLSMAGYDPAKSRFEPLNKQDVATLMRVGFIKRTAEGKLQVPPTIRNFIANYLEELEIWNSRR